MLGVQSVHRSCAERAQLCRRATGSAPTSRLRHRAGRPDEVLETVSEHTQTPVVERQQSAGGSHALDDAFRQLRPLDDALSAFFRGGVREAVPSLGALADDGALLASKLERAFSEFATERKQRGEEGGRSV